MTCNNCEENDLYEGSEGEMDLLQKQRAIDPDKICVAGIIELDAAIDPIQAAITKAQRKLMNDLDKARMFDELVDALQVELDGNYSGVVRQLNWDLLDRAKALQVPK